MPSTAVSNLWTALSRTRHATSLAFRRRDAVVVFSGVALLYLVTYLWMINHLAPGLGGYGVTVAPNPVGKFLQPQLGPFSFRPVARVSLGPITYLFSFNTVLGALLAGLVGLNLSLTYLTWTQPKACGLGRLSSGVLASVPALLSGTACCGPVILIIAGIQASGLLLTTFQFLLPAAALLLVGSLVLVGRQVNPQAVER